MRPTVLSWMPCPGKSCGCDSRSIRPAGTQIMGSRSSTISEPEPTNRKRQCRRQQNLRCPCSICEVFCPDRQVRKPIWDVRFRPLLLRFIIPFQGARGRRLWRSALVGQADRSPKSPPIRVTIFAQDTLVAISATFLSYMDRVFRKPERPNPDTRQPASFPRLQPAYPIEPLGALMSQR